MPSENAGMHISGKPAPVTPAREPGRWAEPQQRYWRCGCKGNLALMLPQEPECRACKFVRPPMPEAEPPRDEVCACGHGRTSHIANGKHPEVIPCWHLNADASYCGCQQYAPIVPASPTGEGAPNDGREPSVRVSLRCPQGHGRTITLSCACDAALSRPTGEGAEREAAAILRGMYLNLLHMCALSGQFRDDKLREFDDLLAALRPSRPAPRETPAGEREVNAQTAWLRWEMYRTLGACDCYDKGYSCGKCNGAIDRYAAALRASNGGADNA